MTRRASFSPAKRELCEAWRGGIGGEEYVLGEVNVLASATNKNV
jgi:hypothetical protein